MQRLALLSGQGVPIGNGNGSPTLVILNDPWLDWTAAGSPTQSKNTQSYLLVGFNTVPLEPMQADVVIPPFHRAVIRVPPGIPAVYIVVPTDPASVDFGSASNPFCFFEWSAVPAEASRLEPMPTWWPLAQVGSAGIQLSPADARGNLWPAYPWPVYDQSTWPATSLRHMRPHLAPSNTQTMHQATVANTIYTFAGLNGNGAGSWVVLKRMYVSVSAAALFVLGLNGLGVGSPGAQEVARLAFPAAGIQVLEFDEGINLSLNNLNLAWQWYASAAVTVDLTAIQG